MSQSVVPLPAASDPARLTRIAAAFALALWGVYFFSAPTVGFGLGSSWHNEHRLLQVAALGVTALLLLGLALVPQARAQFPRVALSMRVLLLLAAVSALQALHPRHAFGELALLVSLAGLAMLTATLVRLFPGQATRVVRTGVLLIAFTQVFGVAARYVSALALGAPIDQQVAILGYSNPRFPSALYALLMPFLVAIAVDSDHRSGTQRRAAWALLVALWCINFALGTRAIFAATAVGVLAFGLMGQGAAARRLGRALLGTMVAGGVLFYLAWLWLPGLLQSGGGLPDRLDELASPNGRELLLASAWQAIRTHPWMGLGPMHFAAIDGVWASHPHNAALQIASEAGIPTLLVALWAAIKLVRLARSPLQGAAPQDTWLARATFLALLSGGALAMVDGVHVMPVSQSLLAIVVGLAIGGTRAPQPVPVRPHSRLRGSAAALTVLAATLFLTAYAADTHRHHAEQEAAYKALFGQGRYFVPRFWQQGLLLPAN